MSSRHSPPAMLQALAKDNDKTRLRAEALSARAAIAPAEAQRAAAIIAEIFFDNKVFDHKIFDNKIMAAMRAVAGYMPIRNEISPLPLLTALQQRGVKCALPVIIGKDQPLVFRHYRDGDELAAGLYDIPQPLADKEDIIPDLILTPLLAFDSKGTRLGYGAGHYDRTLSILSGDKIAVGLAFASQQRESVPRAAHDVALSYVLTPEGWLSFG